MEEKRKYRKVVSYKNYFDEFYKAQPPKVKEKIIWTLELIEDIEIVPEKYLKHLTNSDGLYEIRVKLSSNIYRIFSFFDEGKLVITINGFQKKTQKTPKNQIKRALAIKKEYENEKS